MKGILDIREDTLDFSFGDDAGVEIPYVMDSGVLCFATEKETYEVRAQDNGMLLLVIFPGSDMEMRMLFDRSGF